ncbi:hypothetical protein JCM8097_001078 [Rhodosporidiobolus ruineniae]
MSTPRPAVKRTYGSRKAAGTPAGTILASSPARSRRPVTAPTALPSSSPSRRRPQSASSSADWAQAVAETFKNEDGAMTSGGAGGAKRDNGKQRAEEDDDAQETTTEHEGRVLRERRTPTKQEVAAPKGDLRSFFSRASPRKKRRLSPPDEDEGDAPLMSRSSSSSSSSSERASSSGASSSSSATTASSSSSSKPRTSSSSAPFKRAKLEQLYLDPFKSAGHATLSCPSCSLSYARTPEDLAFHAKHHKKAVAGVDWVSGDDGRGVTVLKEAVEWGGKEGGKVVMVDYPTADAATKRKLNDVLDTIDTELSSTSLTSAQLAQTKLFLFVTPQRKVIAAAVVQRIKAAYEVVPPEEKEEMQDGEKSLLRFGEDQGAIFCSPTPLPTLLGVQRIWTSTPSRRCGLSSLLLTLSAAHYFYGCPIPPERRAVDFAFSQPTGKGQKLARAWTGSERFRVFEE